MTNKELKAAAEAATKEPWTVGVSYVFGWPVFRLKEVSDPKDQDEAKANAEFIALARTAVPALIKMVEDRDGALGKAKEYVRHNLGPGYEEELDVCIAEVLGGAE